MAGEGDKIEGRAKEVAGTLSNDEELRREGKVDQAAGKAKDAAAEGVEKAKDAVARKD